MIDNSIEDLFNSINNSKEYQEYLEITNILNNNKDIKELIEEIKKLQKECVKLEYENDDKYKELDKKIKTKINILNSNSDYKKYLSKLKQFNSTLLASSSLLEDYITEKISI